MIDKALKSLLLLGGCSSGIDARQAKYGSFKVAAGSQFTLIVEPDGPTWGMGANDYGQLGINGDSGVITPAAMQLPGGVNAIDVKAGRHHSLVLTNTGSVYVTGRNNFRQLGRPMEEISSTSAPLEIISGGVKAIAAGYAHSLFLMDDGTVKCAGKNTAGQCGDGTFSAHAEMTTVLIDKAVVDVVAGHDFTYFLTEDHEIWAVGQNTGGQLGDGFRQSRSVPVRTLFNQKSMAAGATHGIFVDQDGNVRVTGAATQGQLGMPDFTDPALTAPELMMPFVLSHKVRDVYAGGESTCVLTKDGRFFGFGNNGQGQLGLGEDTSFATPTEMPETELNYGTLVAAGMSSDHSVFIGGGGQMWGSGANTFGQLGGGSTGDTETPLAGVIDFTYTSTTTLPYTGPSTTVMTTTTTTTTAMETTAPPGPTGPPVESTRSTTMEDEENENQTTPGGEAIISIDLPIYVFAVPAVIIVLGFIWCVCCRQVGREGIDEDQEEIDTADATEMVNHPDSSAGVQDFVAYEPQKSSSGFFGFRNDNKIEELDHPPLPPSESTATV